MWALDELALLDDARELEIAVGSRRWTPIWVVCAEGNVYVRSWYRRDTGWFGDALRSRRARIRVPGLAAEVTVEDLGAAPEITAAVDAAYRAKYPGGGTDAMVTPEAAATTLRLDPR
ncbi:DUF2255 family protein [Amycolatopsis solani]|uniref:DUF2255 family protein n=1 Tax=Amycolatopsis solani TaxID=3028615 RepID=UPI0025B0D217|nr:DUF2255 family protein [Amycolatopsis sp. MEP2-6]